MQQNDESYVDIRELLRDIIGTRVWVVIVIVLTTLLFWSVAVASAFLKPAVQTFELRINFTFDGAEVQQYPNESPFSLGDIVSPYVLNSAFNQNGLEEWISREDFINGFEVRASATDHELIISKYTRQLDRDSITPAEIEQMQDTMALELDKASSASAILSFTSKNAGDVPKALLQKVVRDVPEIWATHMISGLGVLEYQTELYSEKVLDKTIFERADYLIAFEMVLDRLTLLERNIEQLKELPNGLIVEDDVSKLSVPDLEKAVSDIRRYRVAPLINPVKSLGLAKDPEVVQLYFENELIDLQREIRVLQDRRQNVLEAIESYSQSGTANQSQDGTNSGISTQIDGEFIDRIVALTNSSEDLKYRQKLNEELRAISDEVAISKSEIERITRILESMKGENTVTQLLRENYSARVNEEMPRILEEMSEYFGVSMRIFEKLNLENLGPSGNLYQLASGEVVVSVHGNVLNENNLRRYVMLLFLSIVITIPVVMTARFLRG